MGGPSSQTQARGAELASLANTCVLRSEIGGPRSWTRVRGPELTSLADTLMLKSEIEQSQCKERDVCTFKNTLVHSQVVIHIAHSYTPRNSIKRTRFVQHTPKRHTNDHSASSRFISITWRCSYGIRTYTVNLFELFLPQ